MGEIIWAMNPKNDNLASFTSYLRQHASEYLASAQINADFSFPEVSYTVPMTSEQRRNIFLVVKEALHNVIKHSGASQVSISLHWSEGALTIRIEDNGKGFEPGSSFATGNGLTSMRKRIEELSGSFSIISEPEKGTRIYFSVLL
jgi:signal transduction histidine kinase